MGNPPDDGPCEVTITAPDREWLQAFVTRLVSEHLAAAAHVDVMRTTYWWQGEIHEADEARATIHTRSRCLDEITRSVEEEHPFETPCVISKLVASGAPEYLSWIDKSVCE